LYAISARTRRDFNLNDGTTVPVNLASYGRLIHEGRIAEDERWYVFRNFRRAVPGDEVFVYSSDENAGIIGYAIIAEVEPPSGNDKAYVVLNFDSTRSARLFDERPIPATEVRTWFSSVAKLRSNLIELTELPAILARYSAGAGPTSPTPAAPQDLLADAYVRFTPAKRRVIKRLHNRLSNRFKAWLISTGASDITVESDGVDIACRWRRQSCLFELKTRYNQSTHHALREALGQILEYAFYPGRATQQYLAVVLDAAPTAADTAWFRSLAKAGLAIELFWLVRDRVSSARLTDHPLAIKAGSDALLPTA
jgi:hypothetical protein